MKLIPLLYILTFILLAVFTPTDILVPAGGNIQLAINAAQCGDRIRVQAGATWDTPVPYIYSKQCPRGSELTITTSGTLPDARIVPAHATAMPRFRTTAGGPVFQSAPNASGLILDGLEITDNVSDNRVVNYLLDFSSNPGAGNITVQRSFIHQKEFGSTDYTRNAIRAVGFEGSGFLGKWNYIPEFVGRQPDGQLPTTQVMLCMTCNNVTWNDNFLGAWYSVFFTGGGGSNPQHTATVSNASATSATLSKVDGLVPGLLVRFGLSGMATSSGALTQYNDVVGIFSSTVITRTSGETLVDFNGAGSQQGYHIRFVPVGGGPTYRGRVKAVSGSSITVVWEYGAPAPAGTYHWNMWAVAKVNSVAGNVVSYTGYGPNRLLQAPTSPGEAAWRVTPVVHTWDVTRNTFDTPYEYSVFEHSQPGNNSPKGGFELKDMAGLRWEGNLHTGYPTVLGLSNRSNEGGTPWSTMRDLVFRSNFINYTLGAPGAVRQFMISQTDDYSNSATPGGNIVIANNLIKGTNVSIQTDAMNGSSLSQNTIINDNANGNGNSFLFGLGASSGLGVDGNIVAHLEYGLNCTTGARDKCWPGLKATNNVVVLANRGISLNADSWGVGGILTPIPASFSQVGFINPAGNDYRLSSSSPYKGRGSGGSDPGVDWISLVAALGFDPSGAPVAPTPTPTSTPTLLPSPSATPTPTATPTPAASPSQTPLPTATPTPPIVQPTPAPTPECSISAPNSITIRQNGSGTIPVTLTNLSGPTQVDVIGSSGQVTIFPLIWQAGPTSTNKQFQVKVKRQSRTITFQSPCGVVDVRVNVQ